MDRLISEKEIKKWLHRWIGYLDEDMIARMEMCTKDIPSADMFSDLKAEISMYENSEQSIDEMIQGIKSIISIYER